MKIALFIFLSGFGFSAFATDSLSNSGSDETSVLPNPSFGGGIDGWSDSTDVDGLPKSNPCIREMYFAIKAVEPRLMTKTQILKTYDYGEPLFNRVSIYENANWNSSVITALTSKYAYVMRIWRTYAADYNYDKAQNTCVLSNFREYERN